MNDHEQRIAIAKICGWKFDTHKDSDGEYSFPVGASWMVIPDYTDDLNDMHEAEKTLDEIKSAEYARTLVSTAWKSEQPVFAPINATAAQRAEAFLRTIGKWTETNSIKESP
jgi:hypothetical protein